MMTARALEISEFDVFARAWTFWHGETAPDKQIEKHFAEYMFAERVPGFVRHYTRSAPLPLPRVVRRPARLRPVVRRPVARSRRTRFTVRSRCCASS